MTTGITEQARDSEADRVVDGDWIEHWRSLVGAQPGTERPRVGPSFWDRRARGFALAASHGPSRSHPVVRLLKPWLDPSKTVIDVGAGTGQLAACLAPGLRRVIAVEPARGMRELMPRLGNVEIVGCSWQTARVAPADLVICVNVLHGIAEPVPFIEKLEAAATERVFLVMRDSASTHPADRLAPGRRPRQPMIRDAFLLMRQIGLTPDLAMLRHPSQHHFASLQAAVDECRLCLGTLDDEEAARTWLAANTRFCERGHLVYDGGEVVSGVLHWSPRMRPRP